MKRAIQCNVPIRNVIVGWVLKCKTFHSAETTWQSQMLNITKMLTLLVEGPYTGPNNVLIYIYRN